MSTVAALDGASVVTLHQPDHGSRTTSAASARGTTARAGNLPLLSPRRHAAHGANSTAADTFAGTALVRRSGPAGGDDGEPRPTSGATTARDVEGGGSDRRQSKRRRRPKRGAGVSHEPATPRALPLRLAVTLGYASRWHRSPCRTSSGACYHGQTITRAATGAESPTTAAPAARAGGTADGKDSGARRVPHGYGVETLAPDLVFAGEFVHGKRVRGAFVLPATAEELRVEGDKKPHRRIGGPCLLSTVRTQQREGSLRLLPAVSALHIAATVLCLAMALEALVALRVWVAGGITLVMVVGGTVVGWRAGRVLGDARLAFLGTLHAAVPFLSRRLARDKRLEGVRVDTLGGPPRPGVSAIVYMCVLPHRQRAARACTCCCVRHRGDRVRVIVINVHAALHSPAPICHAPFPALPCV